MSLEKKADETSNENFVFDLSELGIDYESIKNYIGNLRPFKFRYKSRLTEGIFLAKKEKEHLELLTNVVIK